MTVPAVSFQNISKRYDNGVEALQSVSLDIKQGSFFALLGANGAGKTTLLGILSTLVRPSTGVVHVMGRDLSKEPRDLKALMGVVPQEFNCHTFERVGDIVSNQAGYFGLSPRQARKRAEYYLKRLSLWDKKDDATRVLSGGMKRRLMIVRALVHDPKILLLDEPTAGVDVELRYDMWEFLKELNASGVTILLTTHYLEEVERLCQDVAFLNQGRIVYQDKVGAQSIEELFLSLVKKDPI
jgi:ABC-2 type transport system ATP-binding protein